jgi:hypothetical protein
MNDSAPRGMNDSAPRGMNDSAPRGLNSSRHHGAKLRILLGLSIALLVFNFALPFTRIVSTFMPNDRAFHLAIVYALACAWFNVYAIRLARIHEHEFKELQTRGIRKLLDRSLAFTVIAQSLVAFLAFSVGIANFYTMAAGTSAEVTRVVAWSEWKRGTSRHGSHCFKHELVGLSTLENKFGAPCLEVGYDSGTRILYRGKVSSLGLHVDETRIEPKGTIQRRQRD